MALILARHAFDGHPVEMQMPPGLTVEQLIQHADWPMDVWPSTLVTIDGHEIPRDRWHVVRPRAGREVRIAIRLGRGGGEILRTVAVVAIAVVAAVVGAYAGPALATAFGFSAVTASGAASGAALAFGAVATAAVTTVGGLVLGAIGGGARPPTLSLPFAASSLDSRRDAAEASVYRLTSQRNQSTPYAPVPRVLGRFRLAPRIAAEPQVFTIGRTTDLRTLYTVGYASCDLLDLRIGDTPISDYRGIDVVVHREHTASTPTRLVANDWSTTVESVVLDTAYTVRTVTGLNELRLEYTFPGGLGQANRRGGIEPFGVALDLEWRWTDDTPGLWRTVDQASSRDISWSEFSTGFVAISGRQVIATCELSATSTSEIHLPEDQPPEVGDVIFDETGTPYFVTAVNGYDRAETGDDALDRRPFWRITTSTTIPADRAGSVVRVERGVGGSGPVLVTAATRQPLVVVVRLANFNNRQISFRTRRITSDSADANIADTVQLTGVTAIRYAPIIAPRVPVTTVELKVQASEQLSGSVDTFTCTAESLLPVGNASGFVGYQPSRNPAWSYVEVLTGSANPRPVSYADIDWPAFSDWAAWCDATSPQGDANARCDLVLDTEQTVADVLQSIASIGRAQPAFRDGLHSIIRDTAPRTAVQMFTPANASGFSSRLAIIDVPHGLRVRYVSDETWNREELVVYDDGYDETNATKFETLDLIGCTRAAQAWRSGRIWLAEARLRRERFSWSCDVENLVAQRGDLVLMQHDMLAVGGEARRIAANLGGGLIELDAPRELSPLPGLAQIRRTDGVIESIAITSYPTTTRVQLASATTAAADSIIVIGSPTRVTQRLLITSITPGPDLSASIEAVEEAPGIESAISGPIPNYEPPRPTFDGVGVRNLTAVAREAIRDRAPIYDLELAWQTTGDAVISRYTVEVAEPRSAVVSADQQPTTWTLLGTTTDAAFATVVDRRELPANGETWRLRVRGYTTTGRIISGAETTLVLVRDTTPPPAVEFLSSNVAGAQTVLTWEYPDEPVDLVEFRIYYAASLTALVNAMTEVVTVSPSSRTTTIPTRSGRYAVVAVDSSGNLSDPSYVATIVEDRSDMRAFDTISMFELPGWTTENVVVETGPDRIRLVKSGGAYVSEGWWYSPRIGIGNGSQRVRLSSSVQFELESDTGNMSSWSPLAAADPLNPFDYSRDFDVSVFVRTTTEAFALSSSYFAPLANASPLDGAILGPWERLDVTDREVEIAQYAVRLRTNVPTMTPSVRVADLVVSTVRRVETGDNVSIGPSGQRINFGAAYADGTSPVVAITVQGASAGDDIIVTNKTTSGFDVQIRNGGVGVARVIDWFASGFGQIG